eukprot:29231_6
MSSIKTIQHGGLLGPNLSSVIDNELWGRARALWHSVDCSIPFTLRFLTFWPCSSKTMLSACMVLCVLLRSISPTPGIFALPSVQTTLRSMAPACARCFADGFRRSHAGHGIPATAIVRAVSRAG